MSNDFIIVAPQIVKEWDCHDTYAYTGDNFATLDGIQPQFYQRVIERLTQERDDRDYTSYNLF